MQPPYGTPYVNPGPSLIYHSIDIEQPAQLLYQPHNFSPLQVQQIGMLYKELVDKVSKTDNVINKFYNEQPCGINYKYIKYEEGYLFRYSNNSTNRLLVEKITFGLQNCYIVGVQGSIVSFTLPPKQVVYIHLVRADKNYPFKADITDIDCQVNAI